MKQRSALAPDMIADGRTTLARRWRAMRAQLLAEMAVADVSDLPTSERLLLERACSQTLICEQLEAQLLDGERVEPTSYSRIANAALRALERLGLPKPQDDRSQGAGLATSGVDDDAISDAVAAGDIDALIERVRVRAASGARPGAADAAFKEKAIQIILDLVESKQDAAPKPRRRRRLAVWRDGSDGSDGTDGRKAMA